MMMEHPFFLEISEPGYDREAFVGRVLTNADERRACLDGMLRHPEIMVYYHCFEVIETALAQAPELFYFAWDEAAALLEHRNSYHRDFGLILLANLLPADRGGRFTALFPRYLERLHDEKFMTASCCARQLIRVLAARPDLTGPALERLLDFETGPARPLKQAALFKCGVLEVIESVRPSLPDTGAVDAFIREAVRAASPKTRKKAAELIALFGLADLPGEAA